MTKTKIRDVLNYVLVKLKIPKLKSAEDKNTSGKARFGRGRKVFIMGRTEPVQYLL